MKKQNIEQIRYLSLLIMISVMVLGLSACTAPRVNSEYTDTHKNIIGTETVAMEISGELDRELSSDTFRYIIREFQLRAKGPLAIEVRRFGQTEEKIASDIGLINQALHRAGVPAKYIIVLPTPAGDNLNAVVSFTAYTVEPPECENWSGRSSLNWSNVPHDDFGCATQRSLGLIVANPGDLESSKTMDNALGSRAVSDRLRHRGGPFLLEGEAPGEVQYDAVY